MANPDRARRIQNESEDSVESVTSSPRSMMAQTLCVAGDMSGLSFLDATSLGKYGPGQILSRMLCTKSYISTDLSDAGLNRAAQDCLPSPKAAHELGAGMCGVVYVLTGTKWAIQPSKPGKSDQLYEDWLGWRWPHMPRIAKRRMCIRT